MIIEDAIAKADLLLVVLFRNWLASLYCRQELESFRNRWQHQDLSRLKKRIVIASRDYISLPERPALLQKRECDSVRRVAGDGQYENALDNLARTLLRRAKHRTEFSALPISRSNYADLTLAIE